MNVSFVLIPDDVCVFGERERAPLGKKAASDSRSFLVILALI